MIAQTLPIARELWRRIVELVYPLYGSREIVIQKNPKVPGPIGFYTDNERIYICLNDPLKAEANFRTHILPVYQPSLPGDPNLERNLWIDTLLFALFHELYHPLICPNSAQDEKEISAALHRGIRAGDRALQPMDLLRRVDEIKNLVWDIVVNVTFLSRLKRPSFGRVSAAVFERAARAIASIPSEVVPILYYQSVKANTADLLIAIMGAFYTILSVPQGPLQNRLLQDLPRSHGDDFLQALGARTAEDLARTFDSPLERYPTIEKIGKFLAPFLRGAGKQGTIDGLTRGHHGSEEDVVDTLEDLIEGLSPGEADDLVRQAARPDSETDYEGDVSVKPWTPLNVAAADEYYKRHAEPLTFRSPDARSRSVDLGRQRRWRLRNVQNLTAAEAVQLDLGRVLTFQSATGLPVLMNLAEGYYQLNEYGLAESPIRSYTLRPEGLEIPDHWVLLVDSSGSMMGTADYVGTGNKYDILMRVCYGVAKGLDAAAKALRKSIRFGVVNFSSTSDFSGMADFGTAFPERFNRLKKTLLVPQNGGTCLDPRVLQEVDRAAPTGRTIWTLITDGEIAEPHPPLLALLEEWSRKPNHSLVFIEIGTKTAFGKALGSMGVLSIAYFRVEKVEEVGTLLGTILVKYAGRREADLG